jgi:hypothetical protein
MIGLEVTAAKGDLSPGSDAAVLWCRFLLT